eukprot:g5938.t1
MVTRNLYILYFNLRRLHIFCSDMNSMTNAVPAHGTMSTEGKTPPQTDIVGAVMAPAAAGHRVSPAKGGDKVSPAFGSRSIGAEPAAVPAAVGEGAEWDNLRRNDARAADSTLSHPHGAVSAEGKAKALQTSLVNTQQYEAWRQSRWKSLAGRLCLKKPNSCFCCLAVVFFIGWSAIFLYSFYRNVLRIPETKVSLHFGALGMQDSLCTTRWQYALGVNVQNDAVDFQLNSASAELFFLPAKRSEQRRLLLSTHFAQASLSSIGRTGAFEATLASTLDWQEAAVRPVLDQAVQDYNQQTAQQRKKGLSVLANSSFLLVATASATVWLFGLPYTREFSFQFEIDSNRLSNRTQQEGPGWEFNVQEQIRVNLTSGMQFLALQAEAQQTQLNSTRKECLLSTPLVRDNLTVYMPGLEWVVSVANESLLPVFLPPLNLSASIVRFFDRSKEECRSRVYFAQGRPAAWSPTSFFSWPFTLPQEAVGPNNFALGQNSPQFNLTALISNAGISHPSLIQGRKAWTDTLDWKAGFGERLVLGISPSPGASSGCFLNRLLALQDVSLDLNASSEQPKNQSIRTKLPYGLAVKSIQWLEGPGKETADSFMIHLQLDLSPARQSDDYIDISFQGVFNGISFNITSRQEDVVSSPSSSSSLSVSLANLTFFPDVNFYNFFLTFRVGDRDSFGKLVGELIDSSCSPLATLLKVQLGCSPSQQPQTCPSNVLSALLDSVNVEFELGKIETSVLARLSAYVSWSSFSVLSAASTATKLTLSSSFSLPAASTLGFPALTFQPLLFVRYDSLIIMSVALSATASGSLGAPLSFQSTISLFSDPSLRTYNGVHFDSPASYVWSCFSSGKNTHEAFTVTFSRGVFSFDFPLCLARAGGILGSARPRLRSLLLQPPSVSCSNATSSANTSQPTLNWSRPDQLAAALWSVELPLRNPLPFSASFSFVSLQGALLHPAGDFAKIQQADLTCNTSAATAQLAQGASATLVLQRCVVDSGSVLSADVLPSLLQTQLATAGCPLPVETCPNDASWRSGTGWTDAALEIATIALDANCTWNGNASLDFSQGCMHLVHCGQSALCTQSSCLAGNLPSAACMVLACLPTSPNFTARVVARNGVFSLPLVFPL